MDNQTHWSVSSWGSQILDEKGRTILQAPDFLSKEKFNEIKTDIKLASFAPEMFHLLKSLLKNDSLNEDPWAEKLVYDLIKKIEKN
jgi:hypothetical protein